MIFHTRPSGLSACKVAAVRLAKLAVVGLGLASGALSQACDGGYPLAPTICDDWCRATQRANCAEDRPADCVADCERESIARRVPRCETGWLEVLSCYEAADDSAFYCEDDQSTSSDQLCVSERLSAGYCVGPLFGLCLEDCLRTSNQCASRWDACEWRCQRISTDCALEQVSLYECQLSVPAVCDGDDESVWLACEAELAAFAECANVDLATLRALSAAPD